MRLRRTGLAVLASTIGYLGLAGGALAAASPTATATGASAVANTSATLHATVNPNGASTSYYFSYGPTTALGANSPTKVLGAGTKAEKVDYHVSGLLSGTTYYYDLTAISSGGQSVTKQVSFKTKGVTPASATTGGPQVQSSTTVAFTGVVSTNDTPTQYYFEYGPTTAYGSQTAVQTATPSTSPTPVSFTVPGLTPASVVHYQLVAVNGPGNTSDGGDATATTFPTSPLTPRVLQYTTPKSPKRGPYVFSTTGRIISPDATLNPADCSGTTAVSFYYKRKLITRQLVPVSSACTFAAQTTFKRLPVRGYRRNELLVYIHYNGNGYLKPRILKPERVVLG